MKAESSDVRPVFRLLTLAGLALGVWLSEAAAEPSRHEVSVCLVKINGVLAVDRPAVERALNDAMRYGAPEGAVARLERGARTERAALSSGCNVAVSVHAHGRRRRTFLSVRTVAPHRPHEPLHEELGPLDLTRPDARGLTPWSRRVWTRLIADAG